VHVYRRLWTLTKTLQSRSYSGLVQGHVKYCDHLHISGMVTASSESCTYSLCCAFDAAFAKLLWPLVNVCNDMTLDSSLLQH